MSNALNICILYFWDNWIFNKILNPFWKEQNCGIAKGHVFVNILQRSGCIQRGIIYALSHCVSKDFKHFVLLCFKGNCKHLKSSIDVSTMTSSRAARTVSLSGVFGYFVTRQKLKKYVNFHKKKQCLRVPNTNIWKKNLVEILLSWSECKATLIKLKHMLKKKTFMSFSSSSFLVFFIYVRVFS